MHIVKQLNNIDNMGASNFSFDNRCIVVTNDDFEMGNVPSLTDKSDRDRCYPSTILTRMFQGRCEIFSFA